MVHKSWMIGILLLCMLTVACSSEPDPNDVTSLNWKVPSFTYTNQDGKPFGIKNLQGKVWMVDFIFTRCPDICPPMTANMVRVQNAFQNKGVPIEIVSFSVDPEHDKPAILKEFAQRHGADFSNWNLLTGYSMEEIQTIASAFKGNVEKVKSDENMALFNHPSQFYLVDQTGKVRFFYDGLKPDVNKMIEDAKEILE